MALSYYYGASIAYLIGTIGWVSLIAITYFIVMPNYSGLMKSILSNKSPNPDEKAKNLKMLEEFGRFNSIRTVFCLMILIVLLIDSNFYDDQTFIY